MKISVFATNPSFVNSVLAELQKHHTVEIYNHVSGSNWFNIQNIRTLLDWCDVAFFDFCHWPLPAVTHLQLVPCKIVARLHGQELYSDARNIKWSTIDRLILSEPMKRKFERTVNDRPEMSVLPLGVDFDIFQIPREKEFGKNICTHATSIYWKKRVYTTIQTFYDLLLRDDEWELYIKGAKQANWLGVMQTRYYNNVVELIEALGIQDRVHFSENVSKEKWAKWLQDKDIFISNSIEEGFHVSLAEAMASGVYPVINCWQGATDYYPAEFICKTQTEMIERIFTWPMVSLEEKRRLSEYCRECVKQFDSKSVSRKIREIIEGVVENA